MSGSLYRARWITHSALYLALAVLLPLAFHAFGMAGRLFLPMHLPVLLAGFLAGPASGLVVGAMAPLLSNQMTGMPPSYAVPLMSLELPVYGIMAGVAYRTLRLNIYLSLLIAMVAGRLVFGLALFVAARIGLELPYDAAVFFSLAGPIITGLPGIAIQLVIVPLLVTGVRRAQKGR